METGQCIVDRSVKLDTMNGSPLDGGGPDLDNIDVERILERACCSARRRRTLYQAPEFTKRLKALENARTGDKVQFECHWTALPRPAVKWYHDDEEISSDDDRFEIESQRRGVLILTLKSTTKADEGSYKCKAENQEGVTSTTGYLSVTGDSRKSRSRESRRKRQRAVSLPPHLRTITEQRSLEEREEVACSREPRSPIQDFIDNIEAFRKDRTWPLLSRHHGADDKRMSTKHKWDDHTDNETAADAGAAGRKSSFERVLDNCENPFAKRPLLLHCDDRVTSEGDLTPNGRDVSPSSRPTSLRLTAGHGRNASDTCGRLPGRVVFPQSKKYKPIAVADVTAALKANAGEHTPPLVSRKPAVSPRKTSQRVSPVRARYTGDGKKSDVVQPVSSKENVIVRVSGILSEYKPSDSSKASVAGLVDAIADGKWRGQMLPASQPADASDSNALSPPADSSESSVRPKPDSSESSVRPKPESNESSVRPKPKSNESFVHPKPVSCESPACSSANSTKAPVCSSADWSESSVRPKPVSIVSPVGQPVDSNESPACPAPASSKTGRAVSPPVTAAVTAASADDTNDTNDVKALSRTCTNVALTTTASKPDPQRPVWLYFFLLVTCCAYAGCSLQSYPANFIFVVTALSMVSFRLLLRRADFQDKS